MRSYRDELYHHGIIGQRWGVKNGPPYPLGSSTAKRVKSKGPSDDGRTNPPKSNASGTPEGKTTVHYINLSSKSGRTLSDSDLDKIINDIVKHEKILAKINKKPTVLDNIITSLEGIVNPKAFQEWIADNDPLVADYYEKHGSAPLSELYKLYQADRAGGRRFKKLESEWRR